MLPVLLDVKDHVKTYVLIKFKPKELHKPFSFDFFFVKIAINEKGEITAISMMTIMTMISSWQTPITQRPFLSEESTISMYRRYLPVQLTPFQKYPGSLQIHRKDPSVLWHMKLRLQLCFPVAHSFTSAKQEARLLDTIQFAFFLNSRSPSEDYWETVFSNHSDDYRRNWFQSESYFYSYYHY